MKLTINLVLAILFLIGLSFNSFAAIATPSTIVKKKTKKESVFKQISVDEIFTMPKKDIEARIGRKLKFKEKLGLLIIRKAVKKSKRKKVRTSGSGNLMGVLSLTLGVLSIPAIALAVESPYFLVMGLLFSIAAVTLGIIGLKRKESKRVFSILGIIFGGAILFLTLMALLIIVGAG